MYSLQHEIDIPNYFICTVVEARQYLWAYPLGHTPVRGYQCLPHQQNKNPKESESKITPFKTRNMQKHIPNIQLLVCPIVH